MPFNIAPFAAWGLGMATRRQFLVSIAAASSASLLDIGRPAGAQTVQKLTRILVGTPAGGYPDTVTRLLINHMKSYASTNNPGEQARRGSAHCARSLEE
jgi:hypothetical protein